MVRVRVELTAMTRAEPPKCETCGYDLRENASGRCPECGSRATTRGRMPAQWWVFVVAAGAAGLFIVIAVIARLLGLMPG